MNKAERVVKLIEFLTDPETQALVLCGRNPSFDGPEYAIELQEFSEIDRHIRYEGKSLLDCLEQAAAEQERE